MSIFLKILSCLGMNFFFTLKGKEETIKQGLNHYICNFQIFCNRESKYLLVNNIIKLNEHLT